MTCHDDAAAAARGEFEHGPDEGEGGGLAGEAADHLRPPSNLDERPLQEVPAADPLAVCGGEAQVADERVEVAFDHGHRRRVGAPVLAGEREQTGARLRDRGRFVEDLPVARVGPRNSVSVNLIGGRSLSAGRRFVSR